MKKLLAVGIIVVLLASLFTGLVPSSVVALGDDWVINGDTVEREDANVYMGATPHTISSGGYVYFDFIPKTFTGDVDFVWGFNLPSVKPTKAELYHPHWNNGTTNREQTFYNVSSFSPSEEFCFYGNSYNTHHYNVTHETCSHWNYSTGDCDGYKDVSNIVCFDSQTNDGTNYTVYWHTDHSKLILWKDVTHLFSKVPYEIHQNHGGMNMWYYVKNVPVVAGKSYQLRAWVEMPVSLDEISGKYWWGAKASAWAISEGHFLDPWYSSAYSHRKQWTITNVNATALTNYPAYINVTDEPEMQADWDDVVFTDSAGTKIPYELENYTASYGDYWVNVTIPGSSTVTGWVYYGNDAASSQENPEGVYDSHTKMVHHMQDLVDSTSNNNDATNHGATYTSSGSVDGAYDFNNTASNYWDCGASESLNITDAITIEAWVYPNVTDMQIVVGKTDGQSYIFLLWDNGAVRVTTKSGGVLRDVDTSSNMWVVNSWYYIAATISSAASDNVLISINGSLMKTGTVPMPLDPHPTIHLNIAKAGLGVPHFNGTIDNIVISSTARSADWTNQSYELVVNQSTWVSWGGAEQYPSVPSITGNTTYNFGANYTFAEGSGYPLDTNSYNLSWSNNTASGWENGTTNLYFNHSTQAHGFLDVDIWGYNSTEAKLSEIAASDNVTIPNNAPIITNTSDWQGDEGALVYLDFDYTDADNDTCTFATNATEGTLNTTTGIFEWTPCMADQGTYFWNFTVNDSYGGEDYYVVNITVNDLYHPDIIDWWNNYTSNNLTHFTILVGDNRTVFFNVTSNQSGMSWYWYKDGDLVQSGSSDNYNATWDVGGIDKEIRVYGSNPNGNTESLYWIIYIEYTAHEIEWLKLQAMHAQTEAEEMIGQTMLFLILLLIAFAFLLSGYLSPNSTLKIFGAAFSSLLFFVLAYAIIGNQFGEKLQMAWLAILLGALGVIQAIFTLLLVISLLYMQFTSRRQAGMDSIPFDPSDRNW